MVVVDQSREDSKRVEKHLGVEDNLMDFEDYKLVDEFVHRVDRHFIHKEDKVFVVLESVAPKGIVDFLEKECAKDWVL